MKRALLSLILVFSALIAGTVNGQSLTASPEVDAVAFRYDSTKAMVEVYYGILQGTLTFTETSAGQWVAPIKAKLDVEQGGATIFSKTIEKSVSFAGTKEQLAAAAAMKTLDGVAFTIPYKLPATAKFTWFFKDKDGKETSTVVSKPIPVPDFDPQSLAVSSLELASDVKKAAAEGSPFDRAGYVVVPNPSAIYGEEYSKLAYYFELYVPSRSVDPTKTVDLITRVTDASGKEVSRATRPQALSAMVVPVIGSIDIDGLPTDAYKLEISIAEQGAIAAQVTKSFYFQSGFVLSEEGSSTQGETDDDAIYRSSEISKYTEPEADERLAQSMYLGTNEEVKTSKRLVDLEAKRRFIFKFWRGKDKSTEPALTEFNNFLARVKEVNKQFTYQKTPGWKTSRGRVWIVYGKWDKEEKHLFEVNMKPYIIWEYYGRNDLRLSSGSHAQFVFLDRQGGGNFVLVHSNVIGESPNPTWENEAYTH